ncbi:MAG: NUDIX domain-containing protein [Lachnospiraceae bacterium]|nr:NUDIX domain-containing protein [Lachnospiraceae bacterium]
MQHIKLPVAVHLFLLKDDKILLSRRYNTGFQDGNYSVVAGHIDGGETIKQAMIREALEEANIILDICKLEIVQVMHRKTSMEERIDYFLFANEWAGELKNNELDKCDDLRWFAMDKLPDNMVGYVIHALKCYVKGISFSDYGWQ